MLFIAPLELDEIEDPELRDLVVKCEELGVPGGPFARIIARKPEQAKATLSVMLLKFTQGNIDHRLKEIIRIQLARFTEDPYFSGLRSVKAREMGLTEAEIDAGSGDYEDSEFFTEAEKVALRYADQMFLDSTKVDAQFYAELKKHYTEPQIMELGAFIALFHAAHMVMRSFGEPAMAAP
jgi:alkylhydroperoxidase family enzyme